MAEVLSYWRWLFGHGASQRGYQRFINRWLILHFLVGVALAALVTVSLKDAADAVLLPLTGILVALSFAWAGNAQALMQTPEIDALADNQPKGFELYVFTYQSAILTILITLVAWALAGLGVYERSCCWKFGRIAYYLASVVLYSLASLTLRECWHVVLGAQWMLLAQRRIRRSRERESAQ